MGSPEQTQIEPTDPPTVRIPIPRIETGALAAPTPAKSGRGLLYGTLATVGIVLALIVGVLIGGAGSQPSVAAPPAPECDSLAGCVKMPNFVGMTGPQAIAVLDALGFTGGREEFASIPVGWTVSSQGTPAGQPVGLDFQIPLSFSGPVDTPAVAAPPLSTQLPAPSTEPAAASAATAMSDGMYEAGVDIAPGRYKTAGGSSYGFCAWTVYSDASKDMSNYVDGGSSTGQMYATVEAGHFLEAAGGCRWELQQ